MEIERRMGPARTPTTERNKRMAERRERAERQARRLARDRNERETPRLTEAEERQGERTKAVGRMRAIAEWRKERAAEGRLAPVSRRSKNHNACNSEERLRWWRIRRLRCRSRRFFPVHGRSCRRWRGGRGPFRRCWWEGKRLS